MPIKFLHSQIGLKNMRPKYVLPIRNSLSKYTDRLYGYIAIE